MPTLADVTNSLSSAEEVTIRPDLARLRDLGVTAQQIGTSVRVAYQGAEVAKWAEPSGKERDVRVTLPAEVRNQPGALANLPLIQRGDRMLTLQQVATLDRQQKPTTIKRVDRQRVATLGAEPLGRAARDGHRGRDGDDECAGSCRPAPAGSWPGPVRSSRTRSRR